jgi:hypothetical protein
LSTSIIKRKSKGDGISLPQTSATIEKSKGRTINNGKSNSGDASSHPVDPFVPKPHLVQNKKIINNKKIKRQSQLT